MNCLNRIANSSPFQVRVDLHYTDYKQLTICLRFPENYPDASILTELKSKTLSQKLLQCLTTMADLKAKEHLGKPQVRYDHYPLKNFN